MVEPINSFSLKWSLKRNSARDTKTHFSSQNQSFNQPQINGNDHDSFDEKIQTIPDQEENIFYKNTTDETYEIEYKTHSPSYDGQNSQSTRVNELVTAAKKLKLDEFSSNSLSAMNADCSSSTEKLCLAEKNQNFNFEQNKNELQRLEKKYCEWLIGQCVPSKEEAHQLLDHSRTLLQNFQEIANTTENQSEEITNILELSRMLVEHIQGSIIECNSCSLDLMDYETYSMEKPMTEKMSTDSNEQGNTEVCHLNWISPLQNQESDLTKQLLAVAEIEGSLESSASEELSCEDMQESNTSFSDSTLYQEDPVLRVEKVKAMRAVLLPRILHMLDNYEEWCEKYVDKTMNQFLEMKYKQTL